MSDNLKKFIDDNREEFDTSEPSKDLWNKIDSKMESDSLTWIKSKWLKYFVFGASALGLVVILSIQFINTEKELAVSKMEGTARTSGNIPEINAPSDNLKKEDDNVNTIPQVTSSARFEVEQTEMKASDTVTVKKDTVFGPEVSMKESYNSEMNSEKSENVAAKTKRAKLYIPEEPAKFNTYSGTLYDGSSLCEVLRAYKFPGKVNMSHEGNYTSHRTLTTVSCSKLESVSNIKAVWIKGKTDKEISLPVKKGFEDILLIKKDGREISPEAISHYYSGLGVITDYAGKYLNMIFKDKVDLILFFKDAEDGDRIVIDGVAEVIVKNKP